MKNSNLKTKLLAAKIKTLVKLKANCDLVLQTLLLSIQKEKHSLQRVLKTSIFISNSTL